MMGRTRRTTVVLAVAVVSVLQFAGATPAAADGTTTDLPHGTDIIEPIPYPTDGQSSLGIAGGQDPLGLIPYPDEVRRYTSGKDVFEVWECGGGNRLGTTATEFVSDADAEMTAYFGWLSNGAYDPDFIVGGVIPSAYSGSDCAVWARRNSTGTANGALFLRPGGGGFAGPGFECSRGGTCPTTYPANFREGYLGVDTESWTTVAHEMGHMLSWPHSYTRVPLPGAQGISEYDNAIDLMSGNRKAWSSGGGTVWGSFPEPYGTTPLNRYSAGWMSTNQVEIWDGSDSTITLNTVGRSGTQAIVIGDGSHFYILGARTTSTHDPIPNVWQGVEMYKVERCASPTCFSLNTDVRPHPPVPFEWRELSSYSQALSHVMSVGDSIDLCNAGISVTSAGSASFTVKISKTTFDDICADHTFYKEIEWLAALGITKGCNPPANDNFCPDGQVTRGQMAAFLTRAFGFTDTGAQDLFTDDDTSIFETDIQKLATAGVTRGCNPPGNDRFCPDGQVTRGQMAAFLSRAFAYTDTGGGDLFTDDDASIFETEIDKLATAGVTKGCNPPANDRFCPTSYVTRGQFAAFLYRAFN